MNLRRKMTVLVLFFVLLCTSAFAKSKDNPIVSLQQGKRIAEYTIPCRTANWGIPSPYTFIARGPGFTLLSWVFDTLLWKSENGEYIPSLATKWRYEAEKNTYRFELDPKAKWHDGKPVTAADVAFTVDYMKKHPLRWIHLKPVAEVKVLNDHSLEFIMKSKWAPFIPNIAGSMPILPRHIFETVDDPENFKTKTAATGSGPFKLVEFDSKKGGYLFEAHDAYHLGVPKVKRLKYVKINPQMQPEALKKGEVDVIFTSGDAAEQLKKEDLNVIDGIGMYTKVLFNHNKPPFSNVEVRRAIAYAINTDEIIRIAHRGYAYPPHTGGVNSDNPYYEPNVEQYDYDPEKADEILKSLGYVKTGKFYTKDGKPFALTILGNVRTRRDADVIKEQLNRFGIKANTITKDVSTADHMLSKWHFDISVVEGGNLGDPIFLNRNVLGKGCTSDRYYKNKKLKQLLGKQAKTVDFEQRKKILSEFQKLYAWEIPSYQIYMSRFYFPFNDKLRLYCTKGGYSIGIPLAYNKMAFVK